jgi:hypothetical protein
MNGNEAQFTKLIEGGSIAAGKAYLQTDVSQARTLQVVFDESTGIEAIESVNPADNNAYNLNGQRIAQPSKGLYIINGKKIIMR